MFATTTLASFTNSSDANFRLWGLAFATKLSEAGLVQTTDTGQINWATVLTPAGVNTFQGYEIWRFNDALQSTAPVFMKIEYGEASGVDGPAIRFQLGSGSNGTGTLTGSLSTLATAMGTATASLVTNYWSGSTGRFMATVGTGINVSVPLIFGFERSKDANGNDTSEAVLLVYKVLAAGATAGTFAQFAWDTATGMKTAIETAGLGLFGPTQGTGVSGTQVATYPIFHSKGVFMNPGLNVMGYFNVDIAALGVVAIPIYGVNHNYVPLGSTNVTTLTLRPSTAAMGLLVRYD